MPRQGGARRGARLARDASGTVAPEVTDGTETEVRCDTILVAIGQVQVLGWLPAHYTERGLVKAGEYGRVPDERAAAVPAGWRRDARPVHGGGRAGRRQARGPRHRPGAQRRAAAARVIPKPRVEVMPYEKLNTAYFRHAPRIEAPLAPATARRTSQVTEVTLAYSREQALAEADRCMSCGVCNGCDNCYIVCPDVSVMRDTRENGHYAIRTHYCKGCLVCVQECPTGCLERVPEVRLPTEPGDVGPDGDRVRALRRRARRAGAVHPPAHRGRDRRLRRGEKKNPLRKKAERGKKKKKKKKNRV